MTRAQSAAIVEIQTGPEPSDTTRIVIVGGNGGHEREIVAIQDSGHSVVSMEEDYPRDVGIDFVLGATGLSYAIEAMMSSIPSILSIPLVRVKPERKPTKAEWRRQMKGRR
jgi:hypothetical protein